MTNKRIPALTRKGRQFEKLKNIKKEHWVFLFEILIMLTICLLHSMSAGHYVDFYPINGTFQDFNPIRRLLDGQIPYRDFQDYLGLGHLYAGVIMTTIFGGDYRGSLMAFSFLTFASFALCSLMVGIAAFKRKEIAAAFTNVILLMLIIQPFFFQNGVAGTSEILDALNAALGAGASSRFVRGMILPFVCFLIYIFFRAVEKISQKRNLAESKKEILCYIATGIAAGFSFGWSNDYGISCWLCISVMMFWVSICRTRSFMRSLKGLFIELIASAAGVLIFVEIFTAFHFSEWVTATFGTGRYQFWYYNSSKSYYLYNFDSTYLILTQAGLTLVYLWKLFEKRGSAEAMRRYGILAFANMTCFCAVNEYKLLSGGERKEVALAVLFLTLIYELINLFRELPGKARIRRSILIGASLIGIAWCASTAKEELIFSCFTEKEGTYVEPMGGNLMERGQELLDTDIFLNGEEFFATYASAQEVVSDTFQPSGTDYIIHVLGDSQREDYLRAFRKGDFKYAATIKDSFTSWEFWLQRANWFFYRELYQNWHPVYSNSYELYWERNDGAEENTVTSQFEVSILDIDESTKKIVIQCDSQINGIADVYIDYKVRKGSGLGAKPLLQTALRVANTGTVYADNTDFESNYLRPESAEYIPVPVVNGYGEVRLTSNPESNTYLQLNAVNCERIYTVTSDYIEMSGITEAEEGTSIIVVPYTLRGSNAINGVSKVLYNGTEAEVIDVREDEASIYIRVSGTLEMEEKNIIKLVR